MIKKVLILTKTVCYVEKEWLDADRRIEKLSKEKTEFVVLDITHEYEEDIAEIGVKWGKAVAYGDIPRFKNEYSDFILDTSDENWWLNQ